MKYTCIYIYIYIYPIQSNPLFKHVTPRRTEVLVKTCTCMYNQKSHPTQPRGGHPSHSNLVRGKLTSPTPNPAGDGTSGLTSYPRRRSKVSEATCLRPQRSAPSRTRTRAVRPRVQRSDHWATHAPLIYGIPGYLQFTS